MLLVGDIGGTNVRLRLLPSEKGGVLEERTYRHCRILDAVGRFLDETDRPDFTAAAMGVAGCVQDGRASFVNRPGEEVSEALLAEMIGVPASRVRLVNDMVAHVAGLDASDKVVLRQGRPDGLVEGLVMPGTGLGIGLAVNIDGRRIPLASEGGHLDFAPPVTPRDDYAWLWQRAQVLTGGRVSWEHVVSGPGLLRIYAALQPEESGEAAAESADAIDQGQRPEFGPEAITAAARGETSPADPDLARRTVAKFVALMAARAGNLCLDVLATRGVYFAGSIAVGIHQHDPDGFARRVLAEFDAVGPDATRDAVGNTPLHLITSEDSGLRGAGVIARELV